MVVCQFYLRGQCKFGTGCRNEHPQQAPQRSGGFGNQSWGSSGNASNSGPVTIPFTQDGIARDFTQGQDKPLWPLSSYGPAKGEPTIIDGLDESAEELRWKGVQALKSGNITQYQNYENEKIRAANQAYTNALANVAQVYKHAHDTTVAIHKNIPIPPKPVFGSQTPLQAPSQPSAFGKPSGFGAFASQPSAFGAAAGTAPGGSAFGSSTPSSTTAFGQPAFGQSAFGRPSFGQSAFGQTSKSTSAFGQAASTTPSAFGTPTGPAQSAFGNAAQQPQSAFGQPSQPQSAFGKPTVFGALAEAGSAAPTSGGGGFAAFAGKGGSAFGGGASSSSTPAFGQSAFGSGNQQAINTSAFGQSSSAFGGTGEPAQSAFGTATAFGQQAKTSSSFSTFGSSGAPAQSAFGQPSQPTSAFGQPQATSSVFGGTTQQPQAGFNAFGSQGNNNSFGSAGLPAKPIVGPPNFEAAIASVRPQAGKDKHDGLLPPNYMDLLPAPAKEAFESAKFEWGKIPEWIPPIQLR